MTKPKLPQPAATGMASIPDDPAQYAELARYLPSLVDTAAFCGDMVNLSNWLLFVLIDEEADKTANWRNHTGKLASQLRTAIAVVREMDRELLARLCRAWTAKRRIGEPVTKLHVWRKRERRSRRDFSRMLARVGSDLTVLLDLAVRTDGLATRRSRGRPAEMAADAAMASLIDIWQSQCGRRPTIATDAATGGKRPDQPFLAFCRAALEPIYRAVRRPTPAIAALAKKHLYPPRRLRGQSVQ